MTERVLTPEAEALLYLTACAVNGAIPRKERVASFAWEKLLEKAKQQKMSAMAAIALESMHEEDQAVIPEEIRREWQKLRMSKLRRRMLFDAERGELFRLFDEKEIWYLPLKGIIIQDYYPVYEMREMTDNDILYNPQKKRKLCRIFKDRQYRYVSEHNVDAFMKEPFFNFEMHRRIFPGNLSFFSAVMKRTIPAGDGTLERLMTPEDFYLHFLQHARKHMLSKGSGIRPLADLFVIQNSLGDKWDASLLEKGINALDLQNFRLVMEGLTDKLLSDPECQDISKLSDEEWLFLSHMTGSYMYGDQQQFVRNFFEQNVGEQVTLRSRMKYLWLRLFPDMEYMKAYFPILRKFPVLLQFLYPVRWVLQWLRRSEHIKAELKFLRKISKVREDKS